MGALFQDRLADWPSVVNDFDFDLEPSQLIVGSQLCTGLERGSRGITIVRNRYQKTFNEDTEGWKNIFRSSDCKLKIAIVLIVIRSYDLYAVGISIHEFKPPSLVTHTYYVTIF
jgi:hypothetical protein